MPGYPCCCDEPYAELIGEQNRIRITATSQTTVWFNADIGQDGCGYAPSFTGDGVHLDGDRVERFNIETGVEGTLLIDLGIGSDAEGVYQECGGTICVRDGDNGDVYSVNSAGADTLFTVGSATTNNSPMRIDNLLFSCHLSNAQIYKTATSGSGSLYYDLDSNQGWTNILGMVSDSTILYLVGRTDATTFKIASVTIPTSPTYTELASFTDDAANLFDVFTLLNGAIYFILESQRLFRYTIGTDALELILENTLGWALFDSGGPGGDAIVEDGT